MGKNIEWTEEFERRLTEKLEKEYQQADDLVIWASHSAHPFKERGVIRPVESARDMVGWIKKQLGV